VARHHHHDDDPSPTLSLSPTLSGSLSLSLSSFSPLSLSLSLSLSTFFLSLTQSPTPSLLHSLSPARVHVRGVKNDIQSRERERENQQSMSITGGPGRGPVTDVTSRYPQPYMAEPPSHSLCTTATSGRSVYVLIYMYPPPTHCAQPPAQDEARYATVQGGAASHSRPPRARA